MQWMTVFGCFSKIQQGCKWYTPYQGILYFPDDIHVGTAFSTTIFTKRTEVQHHYLQLSCRISPKLQIKVERKDKNSFMFLSGGTFTAQTFMKLITKQFL
jgi:hypothetical protein